VVRSSRASSSALILRSVESFKHAVPLAARGQGCRLGEFPPQGSVWPGGPYLLLPLPFLRRGLRGGLGVFALPAPAHVREMRLHVDGRCLAQGPHDTGPDAPHNGASRAGVLRAALGLDFLTTAGLLAWGRSRAHTKLDGRRSAGSALASFSSAGRVF